ncbi:MAG: hypothetical protein WCF23_18145 [Candidatus Nitrosopolaris sp.]
MSQSTELKLFRNDMLDKMKNQIVNEIEQRDCDVCLLGKLIAWTEIVEILKESEA